MKYEYKIKKENKKKLLILLLIVIAITGIGFLTLSFTGLFFKTPINTKIKISPITQINGNHILSIGEESTIKFIFSSERPLKVNASLILPEGLEYLKGNLSWQGFLNSKEKKELIASVRAIKVGSWIIKGKVDGFSSSNETKFKICIGVNYEQAKKLCE